MARCKPFWMGKIQENQLLCGRIGAAEIARDGGNDPSSGTLRSVKRNNPIVNLSCERSNLGTCAD